MPHTLSLRNGVHFAYLGLVNTGLASAVWFRGLDRMSVSAITFLLLLNPVVAVVWAPSSAPNTSPRFRWPALFLWGSR